VDGAPFHSSPEQKERDALKDRLLAEKGWAVYRLKDDGLPFKELEGKAREFVEGLGLAVGLP
jgi:very-short-patch-repair endonuclease